MKKMKRTEFLEEVKRFVGWVKTDAETGESKPLNKKWLKIFAIVVLILFVCVMLLLAFGFNERAYNILWKTP